MRMMRRFNDPLGLGWEGYPTLLALALFAWHSKHSKGVDARRVLSEVVVGSDWFRKRVVRNVIDSINFWGYLDFECQLQTWRFVSWRECPRDWRVTFMGYARLQELLSNLNLTLNDILQQTNPQSVKKLIDDRIREIYKEHWERVRRYEAAASCQP
jgi:hypothetical protein